MYYVRPARKCRRSHAWGSWSAPICDIEINANNGKDAAWSKRSKEGKAYLSLLLDEPSLPAPFYANLLPDDQGRDHSLIWSRGDRRKAD